MKRQFASCFKATRGHNEAKFTNGNKYIAGLNSGGRNRPQTEESWPSDIRGWLDFWSKINKDCA